MGVFLQPQQGSRGRVKEVWGRSGLFRSVGLTGEMGMRRMRRSGLQRGYVGHCRGSVGRSARRGGTQELPASSSHVCSSPPEFNFILFI